MGVFHWVGLGGGGGGVCVVAAVGGDESGGVGVKWWLRDGWVRTEGAVVVKGWMSVLSGKGGLVVSGWRCVFFGGGGECVSIWVFLSGVCLVCIV